ncbi:MAG: phosphatase [Bacteroidetes bacterium GWD2_45_23]|jgi:O-acetyl-ADP-ribose deacetylase (regulator of RNase III)|nr:macro domain-containing protein [Porphyromonadaceae bacterium]OFX55806.1 MAG: phosphatase [Bacteroidetes bacterium GWC2_46_850]OFX73884.1 MAG: phosphatase [Bacteroidetes bacterium GWC1_47_7]OFX82545.1 MAG: phosphatase [Bacteroidetes bacterium GWD2_45_23]
MIKTVEGDMMHSGAEALVNTVNTVGVMGKGIALQFKEAFPNNSKSYIEACKRKELEPGKLLVIWDENLELGKKLIINFPTKIHWRHPSKYEYIEKGLTALRQLLLQQNIKSVAIPPLGSGNGGLDWKRVKPMIEQALSGLDTLIMIYEPNAAIKTILQKQETKRDVHLTPARAALLYTLFAFESMGEYSSLFAANKLAYFLQRKGQKLNLKFQPHYYGPYAIGVEKVLYHLNGVYLKGMEQGQAKPFEPLQLNYEKWNEVNHYVNRQLNSEDAQRVKSLISFLSDYTSELSLEILATVDFILAQNPNYTVDEVMQSIRNWNIRKSELFKYEYVKTSYYYLKNYSSQLFVT